MSPHPPVRIVVADDEPLARERICRLLGECATAQVVGVAANGPDTVTLVRETRPDMLFLDVQMPGADGLAVLAQLAPTMLPTVVFVTAYDVYAIRAFDANAADYLLKPYEESRFWEAFRRAAESVLTRSAIRESGRVLELLRLLHPGAAPTGPAGGSASVAMEPGVAGPHGADRGYRERVPVRHNDRTLFIRVMDVDWFEAAGNYVRLRVGRTMHLVRMTLQALESELDPRSFARVHRRVIVNLDRVRELKSWYAGDQVLVLSDGSRLRVSRRFREGLHQRLSHTR